MNASFVLNRDLKAEVASNINNQTAVAQLATPSSFHPNGFIVTFCDGSTRLMSARMSYDIYARLMSSNGPNTRRPGDNAKLINTIDWIADKINDEDLGF